MILVKSIYSRFFILTILLLISITQAAEARQTLWDTGKGSQIDVATGLMWQLPSSRLRLDWESAKAYCSSLSLSGKSDWRLPNIKELLSISGSLAATNSLLGWSSSTISVANPEAHRILSTRGTPTSGLISTELYAACVRDSDRVR